MTPAALVRVPQDVAAEPRPAKPRVPKRTRHTVAIVHVINPMTAARLDQSQALGYSLRCAYRNGKLQVWTEEDTP